MLLWRAGWRAHKQRPKFMYSHADAGNLRAANAQAGYPVQMQHCMFVASRNVRRHEASRKQGMHKVGQGHDRHGLAVGVHDIHASRAAAGEALCHLQQCVVRLRAGSSA